METNLRKAILIVEDNPGDQLLLTELLTSSALSFNQLIYSSTIASAIQVLEENEVDVILLDLSLPDSSGLGSFFSLKPYTYEIPVIILSGLTDTELALKAISEGAQDYLVKDDFDERLLVKTIQYSIERKKSLAALRISNDRYNLVSKATNDMVWDWNLKTGSVYRNAEQFERIVKLPINQKDQSGDYWLSHFHPDDKDILSQLMEDINKDINKNNFEIEYRFLNGDQQYIYLNERGYIIRDEWGKAVRLIGATQDVTEKKKVDDELKRLSFIARETVNAVIITDPDGKIEWINEAFCNISGYTLAEVAGKKPGEFLQGPESSRLVIDYMRNQINKMAPFECEIINYSKNGRKYWVEIEGQPMFDKYGKLTHYFAIETNITERKMALQALKKSEEQYRYLFNNNPACIFIWYLDDFTIAEINDEVVKQYGYTKTEMYGMTILELRSASDFSLVRKFARKVLSEESFKATSVWKHLHKNGSQMFMQVTAEKIMYNGRPAIISLAINITDKLLLEKKLEEEKRDKEKAITQAVITAQEREREEIGRELHDNVNQILASSRLYLGLVRTEQEVVHPCIDETDKLINCAIEELRALSHSLIPPSLDEDDFIDALNAIVEVTMIGNTLHIEKDLEYFNESQVSDKMRLTIYRIIQEQFNNILKYAKASHVLLKLSNEGDVITLIIKDDGVGFDPAEKSNGVGLINIKTRASLLNGKMSIISAPGKGCELVVQFS